MKKLLFAAVSALAVAGVKAADSTEFGVMKVPSTASTTVVAVPWLASGTGDSSVKVADLVLTSGLAAGDELYSYSNGAYSGAWHLVKGTDDVLRWEPFTITDGDKTVISAGGDDATLTRGQAIVLKRKSSPITDGFSIMGKPASSSATVALGTGKNVYSLVAPPTTASESVDVNDSNAMVWSNLDKGELLLIASGSGTSSAINYTYSKAQKKWMNPTTGSTVGITIPRGTGVWFVSKGTTVGKTVEFK